MGKWWHFLFAGLVGFFIFCIGAKYGAENVLNSDRLKAANDVIFAIIPAGPTPSKKLIDAATEVCSSSMSLTACKHNFISEYSPKYVVNLVTGEHHEIRNEPHVDSE